MINTNFAKQKYVNFYREHYILTHYQCVGQELGDGEAKVGAEGHFIFSVQRSNNILAEQPRSSNRLDNLIDSIQMGLACCKSISSDESSSVWTGKVRE